jgi:uncharacterized protein
MRAAGMRRALPSWLLLNAGAALVVAHGFCASAGTRPSWEAMLYAYLAFAAAILIVAASLGGVCALLTTLPSGPLLVFGLAPALASSLLAFLYVDRCAFATYRFHVGGLAWSAAWLPGGLAGLGVWPASPRWLAVALAATIAGDALVLHWLVVRAAARALPARRMPRWRWLVIGAVTVVVLERTCLLAAERSGRRDVVRMANLVPFYPTLADDALGRAYTALAIGPAQLRPTPESLPEVRFAADAPPWNILWIVLDSWRADAMTADLTPGVWALGHDATVFRSHTSGGDATRVGLVSMLYGLPASTWSQLEPERRSPPLLATLRARGWDLGLFTSIALPDILAVAFGDVPQGSRIAASPARAATKDLRTLAAFEQFVAAPRNGRPFFAFVHLISTHGPYDPTCTLPHNDAGPRARYERAVQCADRLVSRALASVSLADTIVVVTADHGEAFGEEGIYGHAAGLTLAQLRVPLVLHVPGRPPAVVDRPTSHHALPATLLHVLGAAPSAADGVGRSLFEDTASPSLFACTVNECAIHDADGSVTFSIGARYPGELEIRDPSGARLASEGALGEHRFAQVLEFLALQHAALP